MLPLYPYKSLLMKLFISTAFWLAMACLCSALSESNVLVIYNSENADSQAVRNYYTGIRNGVSSYDLNDSTLTPGTISYADFASKIRDPIRNYLNGNNLEQIIQVIVLTKGLPHRIQNLDTNSPDAGDDPFNSYYINQNATFASVDSELTLLQFDLETGEANGSNDSFADNVVNNPYFGSTAQFNSFNRSNIADASNSMYIEGIFGWWRLYSTNSTMPDSPLDAGHIYLTARLDAETVSDVQQMIDRAQSISLRSDVDAVLFDSNGRTGTTPFAQNAPFQLYYPLYSITPTIDDYVEAQSLLSGNWDQFIWNDNSNEFLIGNNPVVSSASFIINRGPVAHLSTYGVNHGGAGSKSGYLLSYSGQLVNGASWIAYESYAAQGLGGVSLSRQQGQVEEWIQAGGTFAIGNVWEPYTIGIPRSEIFLDRFLNDGFTYVEAAWASMLQLSWHIVVIGDPLATANVTQADDYESWIFEQTGTTPDVNSTTTFTADYEADSLANGLEYALDLDPTVSDINSTNFPRMAGTPGNLIYEFTGAEPFPNNVTLTIEAKQELDASMWPTIASRAANGNWSGSATVNETATGNGTKFEISEPSLSNETKRFYRLKIEQAP